MMFKIEIKTRDVKTKSLKIIARCVSEPIRQSRTVLLMITLVKPDNFDHAYVQ